MSSSKGDASITLPSSKVQGSSWKSGRKLVRARSSGHLHWHNRAAAHMNSVDVMESRKSPQDQARQNSSMDWGETDNVPPLYKGLTSHN